VVLGPRGSYEVVELGVEGPFGGSNEDAVTDLGLLELVLLFQGVESVLALDIGLAKLMTAGAGIDGVGDLAPVLLLKVSPVQVEVPLAPGIDQCIGGALAPAVLPAAAAAAGGSCQRGREIGRRQSQREASVVVVDDDVVRSIAVFHFRLPTVKKRDRNNKESKVPFLAVISSFSVFSTKFSGLVVSSDRREGFYLTSKGRRKEGMDVAGTGRVLWGPRVRVGWSDSSAGWRLELATSAAAGIGGTELWTR